MKEKILEQISKELKLATSVDLVTLIIGVAVTLMFFAIAAISAGNTAESMAAGLGGIGGGLGGLFGGGAAPPAPSFSVTHTIIMAVALAAIFVINWYGIKALLKNKAQRAKLNEGLVKLYKDEGVDQYNDGSIYKAYETRYSLFAMMMASVAAVSIIVPLVIFIDQITKL